MKAKISFTIVLSLALILILSSACKRNAVDEPSPLGPSSFAVVLKIKASPNTLKAGSATRDVTTITATLKKYDGVALSSKTIHFEIVDSLGNKVTVGFFEGNESVASRTTNSNGIAVVSYYGPLAGEVSSDTVVYIRARVAWDGKEFISELTPIDIIRDVIEKTIEVVADPNVLVAGETSEQSTVTATLQDAAGAPIVNETIHFEITDSSGAQIGVGYFEGNKLVITKTTDANGQASVTYYGPMGEEIDENTSVFIKASVAGEGDDFLSATAQIDIIRDVIDKVLEVSADPNVLYAGEEEREVSTITATLKTEAGDPLEEETIHFEITDEAGNKINVGHFKGKESVKTSKTDKDGMAQVKYYSPLDSEIAANMTVYIKASVAGEGDEFVTATAQIEIIRDVTEKTLEVSADPNVLVAASVRGESTITTTLTTVEGSPLANETIHFEITDSAGNKLDIGYFEGNEVVISKETNNRGFLELMYYGPLASEITGNTSVYIKASVAGEGDEFITASAKIEIIQAAKTLEITANPNTLLAKTTRQISTVKATLKTADGAPLGNVNIHFEIVNAAGATLDLGGFGTAMEAVVTRQTDVDGTALVLYYGPLVTEITGNTDVYIKATVETKGEEFITATVKISVILDPD